MFIGLTFVILVFGAAFAASLGVDRMLGRGMSNSVGGIFTFIVGYLLLEGLLLVGLSICGMFGGECS
jgi:hypothetical protein